MEESPYQDTDPTALSFSATTLSRNLALIGVETHGASTSDDERTLQICQEYAARIAILGRLAGHQLPKLEFLKGALKNTSRRRHAIRDHALDGVRHCAVRE